MYQRTTFHYNSQAENSDRSQVLVENIFHVTNPSVLRKILSDTQALYIGNTLYARNENKAAVILDILE